MEWCRKNLGKTVPPPPKRARRQNETRWLPPHGRPSALVSLLGIASGRERGGFKRSFVCPYLCRKNNARSIRRAAERAPPNWRVPNRRDVMASASLLALRTVLLTRLYVPPPPCPPPCISTHALLPCAGAGVGAAGAMVPWAHRASREAPPRAVKSRRRHRGGSNLTHLKPAYALDP